MITTKNFPEFKKLYEKAVKDKKSQFVFKDQVVLTSYAKYAVEYIETYLRPQKN